MRGDIADKLYEVCAEFLTDTNGDPADLYNILEGYALKYLDELEEAENE